jgi:peptidyl-prolyl cis-trans isomerase C
MKHARLLSLLIACCTLPVQAANPPDATAPASAPASGKPLAVVNGEAVPAMYASFIRQNRIKRNMAPESLTDDAVREGAVTAVLLAQAAVKKGLDKDPTVAAALDFQKMEMLGRATIEDYLRSNPIKEEALKAEYESAKAQAGTTEYRARHILVGSEKEAKEVIAKLTTGGKKAKFEDLAKKLSKDTSASNGGDLGWVLPANLVPEFAQAMAGLKKGEITKNPVQTRFGWHVIRLEDTRKLDFPEYDKVKARIAGQLQQQQIAKLVKELVTTAKVE